MKKKMTAFACAVMIAFGIIGGSIPFNSTYAIAADDSDVILSESKQQIRKADIVFVIDSTASMGSYINSVKKNLTNFVNSLSQKGVTPNMSVAEYRDVEVDGIDSTIFYSFDDSHWTNDTSKVIEVLDAIDVDGGGDGPETPSDAFDKLFTSDDNKWYKDDNDKFIFLLTDAGYKESSSHTLDEWTDIINEYGIKTTVVGKLSYENDYRYLYEKTGGQYLDITTDDYASLMLDYAEWVEANSKAIISNVPNHIDYIELNGNSIYDFQNSVAYTKVRDRAIFDTSGWIYNSFRITSSAFNEVVKNYWKDVLGIRTQEDFDKIFENITNSEFLAQVTITDLISSSVIKEKLVADGLNGIEIADNKLLYLLYLNQSIFSISEADMGTIKNLLESEDKSNEEYCLARDLLLNKYYSTSLSEIDLSDIIGKVTNGKELLDVYDTLYYDLTVAKHYDIPEPDVSLDVFDGLKIINFGIDEFNECVSTANDIRVFYENVYALSSLSYSAQETLEVLKRSIFQKMYEDSSMISFLPEYEDALINYIDELQNAIGEHYQDYWEKKTSGRLEEIGKDQANFIVSECLDKVMEFYFPEVWAATKLSGFTLDMLTVSYGFFTGASERASERNYIYATSVVYEALADQFMNDNGSYGYFPKKLINDKSEYSVELYETGLLWMKVAAEMYTDHAGKYLIMTLNPLNSEEFKNTINDITALEKWYFNVKNIKCHKNSSDIIAPVSKKKIYLISCPVDVAISTNGNVIAEVTNDIIFKYTDDYNTQISTYLNDDFKGFTKALIVPYNYDVKITGNGEGLMKVQKIVINNGEIIDYAKFDNIPVSDGIHYKEVIDEEHLIAINGNYNDDDTDALSKGDINGDGDINVTDVVLTAAHVKSIKGLSADAQKRADVNYDGDINVTDVILIAAHVKGIRALKKNNDNQNDTSNSDPKDNSETENGENDPNEINNGEYAEILYDKECGRWYVEDDDGNALPLTCTYDPDKEIWYTSNGKELNVVHSDNVKNPNYELPDKVAYLVLPNGEAMQLSNTGYLNTIYNEIDGHKVSAIGYRFNTPWVYGGNYGLIDPNNNDSGIKMTIPDNITYCGSASMLTWGLNELQLSDSLLCIEDSAFMVYDGTSLNDTTFNDLKLNNGLKYIGDKAFFGYSALTSVIIPSSVNHIGDYAFGYYTDIEKLQEYYQEHIGDEDYELKSPEKFYKKIEDFTIYGKKGTEAERYAEANGFIFIDNNEVLPDLISLNETSLTLDEGSSAQLTATISPDNAKDKSITWSSSDTSVATVSNGKVTAISEGKTTITANTTNGKTASCSITVKEIQPSSITLNKTSLTLDEGSSAQLTATISPDNAKDKSVTWSSSDTSVATVSNGKVTAISEGKVTISVKTVNNKTAFCSLTVKKPQEEYIKIYTANDFNNIRNNLSGKYVLMNDIDLTGFESWVPIGDAQNGFNGVIDGNNHTVTYQINESASAYPSSSIVSFYYGLIGYAHKNSWYDLIEIKNLNVCGSINTNISSYDVSTQFIGGLVGRAEKINIRNCCSNVVVNTKSYIDTEEISVTSYVGGIIGWSDGCNIENCINNEKIDSKLKTGYSGCHNCGGICGVAANSTIINNCENYGEIRVSTDSKIIKNNQWYNVSANGGGIAGSCGGGAVIIENCYSNCHLEGYIEYPDDTIAWVSLAGIAAYGEVASYAGCSSNCSYNYNEDTYLLPNGSGNYNVKRAVNELIGPEAFYNSDEGWTA